MKKLNIKYLLEYILKYVRLEDLIKYGIYLIIILILILFIKSRVEKIKKIFYNKKKIEWIKKDLNQLLSLKNITYKLNYQIPKTDIKIDLLLLHKSGIYLINRLNLSGYIYATEHINYWDIKNRGQEFRIINPTNNLDRAADIINEKLKKKTLPVIIVNNDCSGYIIDKGNAMGIKILKSEEQTSLLSDINSINNLEIESIMNSILNT